MPTTTLSEVVTSAKLELPVDDQHTYLVAKVSGRNWLRLQAITNATKGKNGAEAARAQAKLISDEDLYRLCLGEQFDAIADNHDAEVLVVCATTAYFWQLGQPAVADFYWSTGGKAPAPTETAPAEETTPSAKTGAAASTTPRRTSGSGTRTRPTKRTPAKKTSPGRKSSPTAK